MRIRVLSPALILLLALAAMPAIAQQDPALVVQVQDDTSGIGIPFAQVKVDGAEWQTAAADGSLTRRLPAGQHTVEARAMGYTPRAFRVTLEPGQDGLLRIQLRPTAVLLERVEVTAQRSLQHREFYARAQRRASGQFVTREDIERTMPMRFTDLFRGIASAQILPDVGGNKIRFSGNLPPLVGDRRGGGLPAAAGAPASSPECPPIYVVNGVRYAMPTSPDAEFRVADIEGIEVYPRGSQAPAQYTFGSTGMCGVIVVWTRL